MTPLIFTVLVGTLDYGWCLRVRQTMSLAAREGAKVLSESDGTPDKARTAANEVLQPLGLTFAAPQATEEYGTVRRVSVTIQIPWRDASLLHDPLRLMSGNMVVRVTMRKEQELSRS